MRDPREEATMTLEASGPKDDAWRKYLGDAGEAIVCQELAARG